MLQEKFNEDVEKELFSRLLIVVLFQYTYIYKITLITVISRYNKNYVDTSIFYFLHRLSFHRN